MNTIPFVDGVTRMVVAGHTDAEVMDLYRGVTFDVDGRTIPLDRMLLVIRLAKGIPNPEPAGTLDAPVDASPDGPTSKDVATERARRIGAGEPAGYDALARHFHVSQTTIRRRLGKPV